MAKGLHWKKNSFIKIFVINDKYNANYLEEKFIDKNFVKKEEKNTLYLKSEKFS